MNFRQDRNLQCAILHENMLSFTLSPLHHPLSDFAPCLLDFQLIKETSLVLNVPHAQGTLTPDPRPRLRSWASAPSAHIQCDQAPVPDKSFVASLRRTYRVNNRL
jgi:hypothetical protein